MLTSTRPSPLIFDCQLIGSNHKTIDSSEGLSGTVLNVFDKAVNIKMNSEKLLVVSLGQVASPLTINVVRISNSATFSSFTDLIKNGNPVLARKSGQKAIQIFLGSECSILIKKPVRFFENRIAKPDLGGIMKFLDHREHLLLELVAGAVDRPGSLLNPDMTTKGLLAEFMDLMDNVIDLKSSEFADRLSRSLIKFCGRGPGFTPAGDDFISGFLAIHNWIRRGFELGSPIIPRSDYQKLTTWTSFKMMECNALGLVDIEVQDLINSIAEGNVLRYTDSLRRIAKRGHTSGLDFVTGATVAIYLVIDSIRQNSSDCEF